MNVHGIRIAFVLAHLANHGQNERLSVVNESNVNNYDQQLPQKDMSTHDRVHYTLDCVERIIRYNQQPSLQRGPTPFSLYRFTRLSFFFG